jgi:hypothetical protein
VEVVVSDGFARGPYRPQKSNKMPKDFAKRVSVGLKLAHQKKRVARLERDVLRAALTLWGTGFFDNKKSFGRACAALAKERGTP